jgi:hypothetical protein
MSDRLADPLYHRLRRAFPPGQPYTRADWEATDEAMPAVVRQFLEHRLRQHSRREVRRLRRARTDWVNYDHPEMEAAVRTFFDAVATHTRVPADAWDDTLRHAVDYVTAYLVRPVPVLVEFVFGDQDGPVALDAVRQRMQFFRPYGYLREAVRAYAEKHGQDALARDTFASVLARVDEGIATDFDADQWLRLLGPLFEAGRHAFGQERLPVPLLCTFFEEKGQAGLAQQLADHVQAGTDEVGPKAVARVIESAGSTASAQGTESAPDDEPPAAPPFAEPPAESSRAEEKTDAADVWGVSRKEEHEARPDEQAQDAASDRDEPLWKQFQQGQNGTSRADTAEQNGGRGTPRWAQFRQDRSRRADQIAGPSGGNRSSSAAPSPGSTEPQSSPSKGGGARSSSRPDASPRPSASSASSAGDDSDLAALEREILGVGHPSHRERYVEELFGGDRSAYRQVLRRLRTADTWSEASNIIASDIFRAYKVNIYSDAAVHFTDTVEARFKNDS